MVFAANVQDKVGEGVDKLKDAAGAVPAEWLSAAVKYGVTALVLFLVAYAAWRIVKRRRPKLSKDEPEQGIDVMALPTEGPPPVGPSLYYYNVPVRLAAIVLAPAGRVRDLPPLNQLNDVFDAIVPGLAMVVSTHRPLYRRWPAQLSSRGFAHKFFGHAKLPGQGGKGTPWCSAAGIFKIEGQPFMAGLVMRAETTTNLGQQTIEEEAQWLDILRAKT